MPSIAKYLAGMRSDAASLTRTILIAFYEGAPSDTIIAERIGAPYSTVARHCRDLEKAKLITVQRVQLNAGHRNVTQLSRSAARWVRDTLEALLPKAQQSERREKRALRALARNLKIKATNGLRASLEATNNWLARYEVRDSNKRTSSSKPPGAPRPLQHHQNAASPPINITNNPARTYSPTVERMRAANQAKIGLQKGGQPCPSLSSSAKC